MSTCAACGASYDDTFKFCPHCGRAKPEPELINLNVRVAPVRYEEAVLKIEVVGTGGDSQSRRLISGPVG